MREVTLGRGLWVTLMVLMIAGLSSACASIMQGTTQQVSLADDQLYVFVTLAPQAEWQLLGQLEEEEQQ